VRNGAERCVDKSWDLTRSIENLQTYNSALVKSSFGTKGGRDNGEPVRARAKPLVALLASQVRRSFRQSVRHVKQYGSQAVIQYGN
jgi:hypothetical protein